jgi:hypothetical protein
MAPRLLEKVVGPVVLRPERMQTHLPGLRLLEMVGPVAARPLHTPDYRADEGFPGDRPARACLRLRLASAPVPPQARLSFGASSTLATQVRFQVATDV